MRYANKTPPVWIDKMTRRIILGLFGLAAASAAAVLTPVPAHAQVQDRVIDVFGDDPCPSSNGQEIVVCKRHPRGDQFRIPKDLRDSEAPATPSANAVSAINTTGGNAAQIQSCNSIGGGVNAGCFKKEADAWRAQKAAEKKEADSVP